MKAKISFFLISLVFPVVTALAQNADYQTASSLIQQEKYEEALPIIRSLYQENPQAFAYFDRYIECLVNLKQFDEAEKIARQQSDGNRFRLQASLKLAEVLHMKGNREEALDTWHSILERNPHVHQVYYATGNSMADRQEYDAAIKLFKQARMDLNDDTIFMNELANTYMRAGQFEESVREYFRLIILSPDQMSLVQQHFLRMRDETLYEVAAYELEDQLLNLESSHSAYPPLYQLLIWLLLETDEYQRAYIFARQYENRTNHTIYSLFSLGHQLLSARKFEMAVNAFQYYTESHESPVRFRAMEELANAYREWGRYLVQNNIGSSAGQRERFVKAYETYKTLIETTPGYENAFRIYTGLIDLSVDYYKDLEKAEFWLSKMQNAGTPSEEAYLYYAEGRISLFTKDFISARQTFTRADKSAEESELSEKTRYYLSLSDFFAGDFEFAELQLKTLERRSTSYYANDAIKLRMWIKTGLRADSTGSLLEAVSESMYSIHTGNYNEALRLLEPILAQANHVFTDDLTLEISSRLPDRYNRIKLQLLNRVIRSQPGSPQKERLLWDKTALVESFLESTNGFQNLPVSFEFLEQEPEFQLTEEDLADLYEEMLIEFPNGFYAPFVREKLEKLQTTSI